MENNQKTSNNYSIKVLEEYPERAKKTVGVRHGMHGRYAVVSIGITEPNENAIKYLNMRSA